MVTIKNSQRKIPVQIELIRKNIQKILESLGYHDFDIGLWITTNATIRKFNKKYREKDKPTSILSFSFYPDLKPGEKIKPKTSSDENLGDLIISAEFVQQDAPNWQQPFKERLNATIVHGICHLLGYTHNTDHAFKKMQKQEAKLLKTIS